MKAYLPLPLKAAMLLTGLCCLAASIYSVGDYKIDYNTNDDEIVDYAQAIISPKLFAESPPPQGARMADVLSAACFVFDTVHITLCPGGTYTVGSHMYTQTGIYKDTLNALPCDTVRLTDLMVLAGVSAQAVYPHICIGEPSQLLAQGAQTYIWSPATGLDDPSTANPIASPSQTTIYTVTGTTQTANLIFNGDFELGNVGFTSSYAYSPLQIGPQAVYDILADVFDAHPLAHHCHDHTTGNGNLMAANGAGTLNTTVWQQTVPVQPQTDYTFSAWVTNWSDPTVPLSKLQFSVNGQLLGSVFQPDPTPCEWTQFSSTWNSGSATSVVIRLVNQNTEVNGNDFGLDDLFFGRICTSTDTVKVTVHQPVVQSITPVICEGDTIIVGNSEYSQTGNYSNTFQTIYGCDSTVLTNLTVLPVFQTAQSPVICEGDSIIVGNSIYTSPGTYTDVLQAFNGCDSTVTTHLTVNSSYLINQSLEICNGDSIVVGGSAYFATGDYIDTLQTVDGCDSIITTMLNVLPTVSLAQYFVLCEDASISVGNHEYNQTGVYLDTLQAAASNGCDSVVATSIIVYPKMVTSQFLSICEGDTIIVGNSEYSQTGNYSNTFQTINGCDSTVLTNLTVLPVFQTAQSPVICEGDSIIVGNSIYTSPGTYTDVLQAINGCDSTVTTHLTVNSSYLINQSLEICNGDSIVVGSHVYTDNGNYTDTLQTWQSCDSIVLTSLTVLPTYFQTLEVTICEGGSYILGNQAYNHSGTYTANLQSVLGGCDSTIELVLMVTDLDVELSTISPDCFGDENGSVTITQTMGGAAPYRFSINDTAYFTPNTTYPNLPGGAHLLWVEDANGCQKAVPFSLDEPNELYLSLSELLQIDLGDNVQLSPILNFSPNSIVWSPSEGLSCMDCLAPYASPNMTTAYYFWAQDENGCPVEGQIQVIVNKDRHVYAPNVFSPNGDGINDNFLLFTGGSVKAVRRLLIFDRWGGMVFEGNTLTLNEPTQGWDGTHRGLPVNTGVFAWLAEVEFLDGEVEVFKGDVTVVR